MSEITDAFPAATPRPPYYAVIFTNQRTTEDDAGYGAAAERMMELARQQPGFLGAESVRDTTGRGITVSYWESTDAIHRWGAHAEHRPVQTAGRERWYAAYRLRIVRVEAERQFERDEENLL
jgi:heme-degrading monooxygenase HmoA